MSITSLSSFEILTLPTIIGGLTDVFSVFGSESFLYMLKLGNFSLCLCLTIDPTFSPFLTFDIISSMQCFFLR